MLYLLTPALNESAALSRLIPEAGRVLAAFGRPYEIVVVNDGSTDDTSAVLAGLSGAWPVRELRHPANRGYGASLATGFAWMVEHADPQAVVVTMDADNTHPPAHIPDLVSAIEGGAEVVTASYTLPGSRVSGVPPLRRVTSATCNLLFRVAFPFSGAHTYTNGYRAYRASALARAQSRGPLIRENGFPGGVEAFLRVCATGARAAEVPFELHYENRGGASKIRIVATIVGYLRLIARLRVQLWRQSGL